VVSNPNGLTGSCGGGTITATPGAHSVVLAGASLPPSGSCTFSVKVTVTTAGVKHNSVTVSSDLGPGNTASASLTAIGCAPDLVAHVLTAHTNIGTIHGLFCVSPSTSTGTYTQAAVGRHRIVSGEGAVGIAHGVIGISAKGTNLALAGGIKPTINTFTETAPVAAKGTFSLS
jgi:hypothetical protein